MPKVYLDTNIFKFSATELRRFVPKETKALKWGGITIDSPVYNFKFVNPNDNIRNNEVLKREASLLQNVAEAAKSNIIDLVIQHETLFESWGLPNMDSQSGKLYGAPYQIVDGPIKYDRIIEGFNVDPLKDQFDFLSCIKHKRFIDIQKATGAYQGEHKTNRNQLIDAWNIWCAEHSECQYLLTMGFKLIKMIQAKHKWQSSVRLVTPSELLECLTKN